MKKSKPKPPTVPLTGPTLGTVGVHFELCDDLEVNITVQGANTAVTMKDVTGKVSVGAADADRFGLYEYSSQYNKPGVDVIKFVQKPGAIVRGGDAAISVPANSTMEIESAGEISGGRRGLEVRDSVIEAEIASRLQQTPMDDLAELLKALKAARTEDERQKVASESKLWPLIRDYGPDAVGLVFKVLEKLGI